MNKPRKKYKTRVLNEAAFLIISGLPYKSKRIGAMASEWTFEDNNKTKKLRKDFYSEQVKVNLKSWICIRQSLKDEQKQSYNPTAKEKESKSKKEPLYGGQKYYYKDEGKILSNLWGKGSPIHYDRLMNKNIFLSEEDANNNKYLEV